MKTQKPRDDAAPPPPPAPPPGSSPSPAHRRPRKSRFSLRRRKKERSGGAVRGKLRMRSLPGVFLMLGAAVVVVGTALAVAGYWPYRTPQHHHHRRPPPGPDDRAAAGWGAGAAKGLLSAAGGGLAHGERMKLLGPVVMGVGLFILICANAVLYENRDRETRMLLAQMRSVLCSVSAAVPAADLADVVAAGNGRHRWVSRLPAAHLNILCLQQLTSSEPLLQTARLGEEGEGGGEKGGEGPDRASQKATLRTEALHHQESASTPSLHSSHSSSCNSSETDFNTRAGAESGGVAGGVAGAGGMAAAPLFKLNNDSRCLASATSMSTLGGGGGEDWEGPSGAPPRRSLSLSCRTNPRGPAHNAAEGRGLAGREPGAEVRVDMPAAEEEEVEEEVQRLSALSPPEGRRHRSWPRLDLGGARRYLKLDNKDDSVDRLLGRLEQQCSQWDKSFGSGPFQ